MQDIFTTEEINLMCIFDTSSRMALLCDLADAIDDFDTGDPESDEEMFKIALAVIDRLSQMSDEDFAALEFYPEYTNYDEMEE